MKSFLDALLPLFTPVILLGGIWLGFVTPTEAAAVAVCYALFIGVIVLRELSWKDLVQAFYETAKETAMIGFVVAASTLYGWVLMRSGMTIKMAEWLIAISDNPPAYSADYKRIPAYSRLFSGFNRGHPYSRTDSNACNSAFRY